MRVHVSGKGFGLRPELQADVKEKIEFALDRFRARIGKVNAFLEDVNGPKHGLDKSLLLIIDIERMPLVVVEERGEAWRALVVKTAARAAHTVSRQFDRVRSRGERTSMSGDSSFRNAKLGYNEPT
jgi:hypothetical protein